MARIDGGAALNGALAGGVATTLMTVFMKASQWTGLYRDAIPPEKITKRMLRAVGMSAHTNAASETALTAAGHWAFGMAGGAIFGVLHRFLRLPISAPVHGLIFGLLVWFVSYMGWIPAVGLLRHPKRQRWDQALMPALAHIVYGASLGVAFDRLAGRS